MTTKNIFTLLSEHAFFKDIPSHYLHTLASCGSNIHVKDGTYLAHEGEQADTFYLIRRGQISIDVHLPAQGSLRIQSLHAGDIAGWSWIFPPYVWDFDLRVIEPLSAIALDGKCLRDKCADDTALGYLLMTRFAKIMSERLEATRMQLLDIYGRQPHG